MCHKPKPKLLMHSTKCRISANMSTWSSESCFSLLKRFNVYNTSLLAIKVIDAFCKLASNRHSPVIFVPLI